jgi:hypothetical protein
MTRPAPPEPLRGHHWEATAEQEHLKWRLASGKPCRSGRPSCKRPCVAEINRGVVFPGRARKDRWWAYCEQHLYGRWIENGQIMHWRLVEDGSDG